MYLRSQNYLGIQSHKLHIMYMYMCMYVYYSTVVLYSPITINSALLDTVCMTTSVPGSMF